MTVYAWRITLTYAYVVKHCGIVEKITVHIPLRMAIGNGHGLLRHLPAMQQQEPPQLIILCIKMIYYIYKNH